MIAKSKVYLGAYSVATISGFFRRLVWL